MNTFFKELFEYSNHYNQKLIALFEANQGKVPEKSVKLFNHILNAHQIWNCRIELIQAPCKVWEIRPAAEHKQLDETNYKNSVRILDNFDLAKVIEYTNSSGQAYSNTIKDILFHVSNHSTYHRGQIASDLKQAGIEPLITDYIFYKR